MRKSVVTFTFTVASCEQGLAIRGEMKLVAIRSMIEQQEMAIYFNGPHMH